MTVGYDNNSDDDIDDSGDDLVWDETFGSTSVTVSHDHTGNLIDDGVYRYVYDAWNRLIKVQQREDSAAVTIQTAGFDATGRRMKKVISNAGGLTSTVVYLYDAKQSRDREVAVPLCGRSEEPLPYGRGSDRTGRRSSRRATEAAPWCSSLFTGRSTSTSGSWCAGDCATDR